MSIEMDVEKTILLCKKIKKIMDKDFRRDNIEILHHYGSFCDFKHDGNYYSVDLTKKGNPITKSVRRDYR